MSSSPAATKCDHDVLIIGMGISGIITAVRMKDAGVPLERMLIVDAADDVGGTWHWNRYPGCATDSTSYGYLPFLDRTRYVPSKKYPPRSEIKGYLQLLVDNQELRPCMRFCTWVTGLEWNDDQKAWKVEMFKKGREQIDPYVNSEDLVPNDVTTARHVVMGGGPIAFPRKPDFDGLEKFKGNVLYTQRWNNNVDLVGKRIGIIGTGCSCAQIIESIGYHEHPAGVKELLVFQRTPSWLVPRDDAPTKDDIRKQITEGNADEPLKEAHWLELKWYYETANDPKANKELCDGMAAKFRATVKDPETAEKLIPSIGFFAKRPLVMDHYMEAYNNPKVKLVAEGGIVSADETGLTTKEGNHYDVDVVISAAGFDAFRPNVNKILGKNGLEMNHVWGFQPDDTDYKARKPKTLLGIHVPNFPNLYTLIGPQCLNPATTVPLISDNQALHIAAVVKKAIDSDTVCEATAKDAEEWTEECRKQAVGRIWNTTNSWYNKDGLYANENNYWGTIPDYYDFVAEKEKLLEFTAIPAS